MAKQILFMLLLLLCAHLMPSLAANFYQTVKLGWGGDRAKILDNGNLLQLSLDKTSGSGFESIQEYLFGKIDMQIKVVPGNSAGTVTAYYLSSQGGVHDEIDYEFLGNSSGEPYTLHTIVYSKGVDNREQQFKLWFDPSLDFHTYSILWNPINIIFYVDNTPIRVFRNLESKLGVPYPRMQPLRLYSSIWNADDWATRGGLVKTDWSQAPFTASYRNFNANACVISGGTITCPSDREAWWRTTLNAAELERLRLVRQNNMIYDYCRDAKRFPHGFPPECYVPI